MKRIEIEENGVIVNVPQVHYFRLDEVADAATRTTLGLKDMDVGWFEADNKTWYLIEQKAYYDPQNPQHRPPEYFAESSEEMPAQALLKDYLKKALDTLLLFLPNRSTVHKKLAESLSLPKLVAADHGITIVFLIRVSPAQSQKLKALQTELNHLVKPLKETFNIQGVVIIDYDRFKGDEEFPWIGPLPSAQGTGV